MDTAYAPQAHPAGEHFRGRHDSVTLRPLRLCASAFSIPSPYLGLVLDPEIGTADYADSKDGQTLAGDCDLTCRMNSGGKPQATNSSIC